MKLNRQTVRERLLASTMIGGSALMALAATPAFAADQPSTVQEVVVTGSRIPTPGLTSVSPLSVVNNQEVKLQGTTNTEDLLNNMPQVMAEFGTMESNGSTATATVNLRGLGDNRTLVLIDGKRVQPGDFGTGGAADLNQIPASLIDRVEIVTGGASAVYGSDAEAGVVNFIMKKDFEGVRFDAEYKFDQHHQHNGYVQGLENAHNPKEPFPTGDITDGATWQTTIVMGSNSPDGKGNVTAYAGYQHTSAVLESARDFSACSISTIYDVPAKVGPPPKPEVKEHQVCAGSSTAANGRFFYNAANNFNSSATIGPNGTFVPWSSSLKFNFAPYNFFQRPDERYTGGYFAHYQVRPWADAYSSFMFMDDSSNAQIAPGGAFLAQAVPLAANGNPENPTWQINCNNPLLTYNGSNGTGDVLCGPGGATSTASVPVELGRRNVEGGTRNNDIHHVSFRVVEGVKGDFADAWHYDVYGQFGETNEHNITTGDFSNTRIQRALQVVADPRPGPNFGKPVCKSVLDGSDVGCVPWDIWHLNPGGKVGSVITQAMENYLSIPTVTTTVMTEQIVHGDVGGDLGKYGIKMPWAKDGVGVSFGAEYRREALNFQPDLELQMGDEAGGGGTVLPVNGAFDVKELFGEVRVPIIQDMSFAKELTFEGGYRTSDYSSAGQVESYKAALDWQIVDDLRLRASFQRAVRAPNVSELFRPDQFGLFAGQDPCSGTSPIPTLIQCEATGLTAAQAGRYGHIQPCSAAQCTAFSGGNPNLKPEESNTVSFGLVFTPTFFRGFSATVDYFNITVNNELSAIPPNAALAACIATAKDVGGVGVGDPLPCGLIHRSPVDQTLQGSGFVTSINRNIGALRTKGVDWELNYKKSLADLGMGDHGTVSVNWVGTYLQNLISEPIPGFSYDCAGLFGVTCGIPSPHWRHKMRLTWVTPWNASFSLGWRYFGDASFDQNVHSNLLLSGPQDNHDAHIPAYNWFDLSGTWKVKDGYTLRFGVNNIFDKDPPILDTSNVGVSSPPFGNGNTFPQVYDALGRTFFIGLTADF
jgi:outer membrane receptor protein involved in Fe transport